MNSIIIYILLLCRLDIDIDEVCVRLQSFFNKLLDCVIWLISAARILNLDLKKLSWQCV